MASKAEIFKYPFEVPCSTPFCTNRSKWAIGKQKGPHGTEHPICDECLDSLIQNIPEDKLPVKEVIKEVIKEVVVENQMVKGATKVDDSNEVVSEDENVSSLDDINLESMGVRQLKQLARDMNLEGYSNLNKEDLVKLLEGEV
jgi:hypothetical protein